MKNAERITAHESAFDEAALEPSQKSVSRLSAIATELAHEISLKKRFIFEAAYSEWLASRAAIDDPTGDESDAAARSRSVRNDVAMRALIGAPAPYKWALKKKAELAHLLLDAAVEDGIRNDDLLERAVDSILRDAQDIVD